MEAAPPHAASELVGRSRHDRGRHRFGLAGRRHHQGRPVPEGVGAKIYLRLFYEFDQPVGHPRYIGTPAEVVAAWQRLVGLFRAAGATNVKFVWCPMAFDYANGVAPTFWLGAAYVDYVGADGYDFPGVRWWTFGHIFTAAYAYAVGAGRPGSRTHGCGCSPIPMWRRSSTSTRSRPKAYDFRLFANPADVPRLSAVGRG